MAARIRGGEMPINEAPILRAYDAANMWWVGMALGCVLSPAIGSCHTSNFDG